MGSAKDRLDSRGRQKTQCLVCGRWYHRVDTHVEQKHSMTVSEYKETYPEAPLFSEHAFTLLDKNPKTSKTSEKELKEKFHKKGAKVDKKSPLNIGVASLYIRRDLTEIDKLRVPRHDPKWFVGDNVYKMWEDISVGIESNEPVFIGGPTGCGKSATVKELAAILEQPVCRVQLSRDFKVSQFVGKSELRIDKEGNQFTEFVYGVLPLSMKNGWWLLLDEIDQAHPDVLMAVQAVLEGEPLVLTENYGEVIEQNSEDKSKYFRLIATANTFGKGDDTGLYAGAKIMNEATLDRFGVTIKGDYPAFETEVSILRKKSPIGKDDAEKIVTIAHKVREAVAKDTCSCTFSTRRLIMWSKKFAKYKNIHRAANVSILNKLQDDEDVRFISNLIQRYYGGEVV